MSRFIFSVIFLACCMAFVESASAEHPPGTLLWQDRFAAGEDPTARVTVNGTRAFVAGKAPSAAGNSTGWLVRAYDAASGSVLWQDAVTGFSGIENKAQTVASKRDLVLAGGFTSIASFADFALVRAYDARTGTLRWEDRFNFGSSFAAVNQIAFAEDDDPLTVLAVGRGVTPDFKTEWFIRAYDARTGVFLWQDVLDGGRFNDALSVTSHKGRAFVSGFTLDATPASRHFTVRAYDARTGILIWQDRVASGNLSFFGGDAAVQVAAEDNRVVAVGVITDTAGFHFAVRTYDAKTGALLWADLVNTGSGLDSAASVALRNNLAFVVGQGGAGCSFDVSSDCDWLVRTYDLTNGSLVWQKQVDRNKQDDQANVVLACGNRIVVAGGAGNNSVAPFDDWRVQVLAAKTGELIWEDVLSTPGSFAAPVGLAAAGNRLFVTGSTLDLAGGTQNGDFIVRAHEFGVDEDACEMVANNMTTR